VAIFPAQDVLRKSWFMNQGHEMVLMFGIEGQQEYDDGPFEHRLYLWNGLLSVRPTCSTVVWRYD
jgi:hypothetical protein